VSCCTAYPLTKKQRMPFRLVQYDAHIQIMTNAVPRIPPRVFRPTNCPHVLLACFMPHSDTVTHVFQFCDWSDDTGSSVIAGAHSSVGCYRVVPGCTRCYRVVPSATGLYPHLQNLNLKCTNVDMMKLNVLHDLFVSIFLKFCLYCSVHFLSFIHFNNGAVLGCKSVTTNSK
jgi:hypothetical protein